VCQLFADRPDPWNAALAEAGESVRFRRWSDARIRTALAAFWAAHGRPPATRDLREPRWHGPSVRTVRRRYGSVAAAWRVLGPVPDDVTAGPRATRGPTATNASLRG
jgi:hypothetical protein